MSNCLWRFQRTHVIYPWIPVKMRSGTVLSGGHPRFASAHRPRHNPCSPARKTEENRLHKIFKYISILSIVLYHLQCLTSLYILNNTYYRPTCLLKVCRLVSPLPIFHANWPALEKMRQSVLYTVFQVSREKEGQGLEVNKTLVSSLHSCPTLQAVSIRSTGAKYGLMLFVTVPAATSPGRPQNDASSLIHS